MQRTEQLTFKIERTDLQNPNNLQEMELLLNSPSILGLMKCAIDTLNEEKKMCYQLNIMDPTQTPPVSPASLNISENAVLRAICAYIDEHINWFNNPTIDDHSFIVRVTTTTTATATVAPIVPIEDITIAVPTNEDANEANEADESDNEPDEDAIEIPSFTLAALADNNQQANDAILTKIKSLLNLDIWKIKGRALWSYHRPTGIDMMLKLEEKDFSLNNLSKIASDQLNNANRLRTETTILFYKLLETLIEPNITAENQEKLIKQYAIDIQWEKNKGLFSKEDHVMLANITGTLCYSPVASRPQIT